MGKTHSSLLYIPMLLSQLVRWGLHPCVTGLSTVSMAEHWSLFGQAVILFLIQFGGLGIVTFTTTLLLVLGRRITLKERLLLQDAYNLDELKGLVRITIRIIKGTLVVEGAGAFLSCFRFVPQYGFLRGKRKRSQGLWIIILKNQGEQRPADNQKGRC